MSATKQLKTATAEEILALPMDKNDAGAETIKDYLKELLSQLVARTEGFSGKRPFGNSGWDWYLYLPLLKADLIHGSMTDDDELLDLDDAAGQRLIQEAIRAL